MPHCTSAYGGTTALRTTPVLDALDAMLTRLQLTGIRDQLDSLFDEVRRANRSARETLALLCEREIAGKDRGRIDIALKLAHLPVVKDLGSFDFEAKLTSPADCL